MSYLFKVYVNGDFYGTVEAAHHDGAVSFVRKNWLLQDSDQVRVIRFKQVK